MSLPGTLIPQAFAVQSRFGNSSRTSGGAAAADTSARCVYFRPLPAYKCLPDHACTSSEVDCAERPCVLPLGFELRPTPADGSISNFSSQSYPARTCNSSWKFNPYILVLGKGYAPIIGRGLRLAHTPTTLVFEPIFSSYSIFFEQSVLDDGTGVQFYPAYLFPHAEDINYYAKQDTDYTRLHNVIPDSPPGGYFAFGRLSGKLSVKPDRRTGQLVSNVPDHPVVAGDRLFHSRFLPQAGRSKPAGTMQEGGIGFLVFRPDYDSFPIDPERAGNAAPAGGQLTQFYFRCAFGPEALDPVDVQTRIVHEAVQFAVDCSPKDAAGVPFVSLVHATAPILVSSALKEAQHVFETTAAVNAADEGVVTRWLLAASICRENRGMRWEDAELEARFYYALGRHLELEVNNDAAGAAVCVNTAEICVELSLDAQTDTCVTETPLESARTVMHLTNQRFFSRRDANVVFSRFQECLEQARQRAAAATCSPVLFYTAPPDETAFAGKPIVVIGVLLAIRLGVTKPEPVMSAFERRLMRRTAADLGTRFMCDAMLLRPVLAVTPCKTECMLSLFTDKAPGLLNVRSACRGMPIKATSTSDHRRIRNAHPAIPGVEIFTSSRDVTRLPVAGVPEMTREQADRNPLLRALLRGGKTPYEVPGVEASIYDSKRKCETIVAGTRHSWPVKGAILYKRIMTPRDKHFRLGLFDASVGEVERREALQFLFPPDYNSAACQIYSETGAWSLPGTTHRKWKKPYGVDVSVMHRAMWWWYAYPAFICDKATPAAIDIWALKMRAEAEVHWMGRWGRVIRQMLNKRRRKVRSDYSDVVRNYFQCVNRVPGAPIADMLLSAVNVFRENMILGVMQVSSVSETDGEYDDEFEKDDFGPARTQDDDDEDENETFDTDVHADSDAHAHVHAHAADFEAEAEAHAEMEDLQGIDPLAMLYSDVIEVTTAREKTCFT